MDAYLNICEQRGIEPDPENMPPEFSDYPHEVQVAFLIYSMLPDRWDGASGTYLGKDWSALGTLLTVHQIDKPSLITIFLKQIDVNNQRQINSKLEKERKAQERRTSGSNPQNIPKIPRRK